MVLGKCDYCEFGNIVNISFLFYEPIFLLFSFPLWVIWGVSVLGANLLIWLLCWELNQEWQSIKSTNTFFPLTILGRFALRVNKKLILNLNLKILILELQEFIKKQTKRRSIYGHLSNVYNGVFAKIINVFQQLTIFPE